HLYESADMMADIACVALNRLPPRYIRHEVDLAFFQTDRERDEADRAIADAVEFAFGFVQARNAMRARI
ncbi:MAG TPA: late competence development ComFB family protein, partial [Burkholderiaceae bacterium]|nr:late competence development ComFB family protein [Burkholderiaceae bacterium]